MLTDWHRKAFCCDIVMGSLIFNEHKVILSPFKNARRIKKKRGEGGYKMGKVRVWHGEEKNKKTTKPTREEDHTAKDADSFLSGHKVRIHFLMSGHDPMEGFLVHVGKFQLVLKTADGIKTTSFISMQLNASSHNNKKG